MQREFQTLDLLLILKKDLIISQSRLKFNLEIWPGGILIFLNFKLPTPRT